MERYVVKQHESENFYERCWELIDTKDGRVLGSDGGEPEDQLLVRDWAWVADELNKLEADHRREVEGLIKERDAYKAVLVGGEYENVERLEQQSIELCTVVGQAAATRTKELVQQVAQLTAERDEAIKDQYMIIPQSGDTPVSWEEAFNDTQHDLTTLRGLVEAFIEAWDHDGEPNAAAYEDTVAKARATLAQPNVSTSIIGKQLPPPQWDKNAEVRGDIS